MSVTNPTYKKNQRVLIKFYLLDVHTMPRVGFVFMLLRSMARGYGMGDEQVLWMRFVR